MPVYDVNIDALLAGGDLAVGGAATVVEALSDASDSSWAHVAYVRQVSIYSLANPSSPSGRLCSIGIVVRTRKPGGAPASIAICSTGGYYAGASIGYPFGNFIADSEALAPQGQDPDSPGFYGVAPVGDNLALIFHDYALSGQWATIYKALARLYYLPNVSCGTPSAPTGTVTATQMPACTVPLSLLVESWQLPSGLAPFLTGGDVEFAVYRSADAPGAAPPATPDPVWTHVERFVETTVGTRTPDVSATPDVPLDNGSYVVFARASRDLMSGAQINWSAWAKSSAWVQAAVLPTAITLTPTADGTNQRMALSVNCPATTGFDSSTGILELQRLVGGVWRDVRGLTNVVVTIGSTVAIGHDYECERAATNTYRSRVSMVLTADGIRRYGVWAQVAIAGPAVTGWNLKTVEDPAGNWITAPVVIDPTEDSQTKVGLFEVLDRDLPVVVSGTVGGMGGALELQASGAAQIALLEALRDYTGVVLLETAFGDVKYVRFMRVAWVRRGTRSGPRRYASLTYAEVEGGLAVRST